MGEPLVLIFDQEYLSIPEIVERFAEVYHIEIRDIGSGKRKKDCVNSTYKTIYQHIKRDLDEAVDRGEGGDNAIIKAAAGKRGDRYARELVYRVLNNKSVKSLMYLADQAKQTERQCWQKKAHQVMQQFKELRAAGLLEPEKELPLKLTLENNQFVKDENWERMIALSQQGIDITLEEEFQKKKLEIMMDYIFRYCIDINEGLLKNDISADFVYDPTDDEDGEKLEAIERLKNLQNYYSIPKKDKRENGGQV